MRAKKLFKALKKRRTKKDSGTSLDLSKLDQNEIDLAVYFIDQALLGFVRMTSKQKAIQLFESIRHLTIRGDDNFYMTYTINTIGNDLIGAVGAAKNMIEREASRGKESQHNAS